MSCTPIGSPSAVSSTGTVIAGSPATFTNEVNGVNCTCCAKFRSPSSASYQPTGAGRQGERGREHRVERCELADDALLEPREPRERLGQLPGRHGAAALEQPARERLEQRLGLAVDRDGRRPRLPDRAERRRIAGLGFGRHLLDAVAERRRARRSRGRARSAPPRSRRCRRRRPTANRSSRRAGTGPRRGSPRRGTARRRPGRAPRTGAPAGSPSARSCRRAAGRHPRRCGRSDRRRRARRGSRSPDPPAPARATA